MPARPKKLNVAICGGGFGGLSLAVALQNCPNVGIQIYEKAVDLVPMAGAGMSVWPRSLGIFRKWGVDKNFMSIVTKSEYEDMAFQMFASDQPRSGRYFHTWKSRGGMNSFHRAHFLELLAESLPKSCIHYNMQLLSYSQDQDGITLFFANGQTATCDLLVGCDGLWSSIRTQMYKELRGTVTVDPNPFWSGTVVFRALLPRAKLESLHPTHRALKAAQMYCGKSLRILSYTMNKGEHINFVAFFSDPSQEGTDYEEGWSWQTEVTKAFLEETFANWEPEVQQLISLIPDRIGPPGPTRWPIYSMKPLPKYVFGRVVLLGDAAHATTPHWGFGAGSSIEDANVLAALLADPSVTHATLSVALSVYDKLRVAEGRRVIEGSRQTGFVYEMNSPVGDDLPACAEAIQRFTSWIGNTDPEDDVEAALNMLRTSLIR